MANRRIVQLLISGYLLVLLGIAEIGQAQNSYVIVDAINTSASVDSGPWTAGSSHGFEYTPSTSYTFQRIETMFGDTRPFTVTVALYDGRNGPLLASGTAVPSTTYSWIPFDLDAPVSFTADETYFIALQPPSIVDSLPGTIVGGDTVLPWWFAMPGTLDFNTPFGTQAPGFRFYDEDVPIFENGFEDGTTDGWSSTVP